MAPITIVLAMTCAAAIALAADRHVTEGASLGVAPSSNLLVDEIDQQLPLYPAERVQPFVGRQAGQQLENLRDHGVGRRVIGGSGRIGALGRFMRGCPLRTYAGRGDPCRRRDGSARPAYVRRGQFGISRPRVPVLPHPPITRSQTP